MNEKYSSVDTLGAYDDWKVYKITANSDKQIEYSFSVQGSGRILVLLVIGHTVTLQSDYLILYSEDDPVKSYSNTFPVGSNDGTKFSLVVTSEEFEEITYEVDIKVVDTPLINYICGGLILFGLIFGGVIVALVLRSRKKKQTQAQQPYQYPQHPYAQPPPAQTQTNEVEWEEVEVVEPIKTQPPPPKK